MALKLGTEIRREQIVQAALELVASQGLRRLSVAAVARKVGLVPSALYRHFRSKDEVLDAVLELLRGKMLGNVARVKEAVADPETRLKLLLEKHAGLIRDNQAFPRIIFSDEVYSGHSERKRKVSAIFQAYLGEVVAMIREGQKAGKFRKDQDPHTLALMYVGLVVPAAIYWHASDGQIDVMRHVKRAWRIFIRGVRI